MVTISEIRKHGTQDEKDWANYLLRTCARVFAKLPPRTEADPEQRSASVPDSPALAFQKNRAMEQLTTRCNGVKQLTSEEREALTEELAQGSSMNQSALAQMRAIQDDRWNEVQAKLISNSLYSGDPILAKSAFVALHTAIDPDAPGGRERQIAFQLALAPTYLNFPLSQYEQLQACRSMGWCDSWGSHEDATPPNQTVVRLMARYRAAVDSHMDARGILAIR